VRSLVTGGAGFIGSHLVRGLLDAGHEVRVIDNLRSGSRAKLAEIAQDIEFVEGDILDRETLRRLSKGVDRVFHLAAMPSVRASVADPETSFDINIRGTHEVLLAARDAEVGAVMMASSSSVYGDTPTLPKNEEMAPRPLCPYAAQKLALEGLGQAFSESYAMNVVCLRYFNVFGPRQDPASDYAAVIPKFITKMLAAERPCIYGDGEQTRDFTYVANVVAANLRAAEVYGGGAGGRRLIANIATGTRTSVNELFQMIAAACGLADDFKPRYEEPRTGEIKHSIAAVELAENALGFSPSISFKDGLARTVAWYQEAESNA